MEDSSKEAQFSLENVTQEILGSIEREREREIISRRFGLFDRRETLEQIGEMLGITRERVRQLEKSVLTRLKTAAEQGSLPNIKEFETRVQKVLADCGQVAKISYLSDQLSDSADREEQSRIAF